MLQDQKDEEKITVPGDLQNIIIQYASVNSLTNEHILAMMRCSVFKNQVPANFILLLRLLNHVVKGELDQAKTILESAKDNQELLSYLLTTRAEVTDYSGRRICGTALQMALGAEDVDVVINGRTVMDGMAEMIREYLLKLPEGEAEIAKQYKEQFPEGWEALEKGRAEKDSATVQAIFTAIANATPDECEKMLDNNYEKGGQKDGEDQSDLRKAFEVFRNHLKPQGVITSGKYFNPGLLLNAYNTYAENYNNFVGTNNNKNKLVAIKIIGYIQRFMPASTAQIYIHGIYSMILHARKLQHRTFTFRNDFNSIFPLNYNPVGLGFKYYAVMMVGTKDCSPTSALMDGGCNEPRRYWVFAKLMSIKNISNWQNSRSLAMCPRNPGVC